MLENDSILSENQKKGSGSIPKSRIPQNSRENLKSKIGSLTVSLKNLAAKKARLEFEIRQQSRALYGKRLELKKLAKSNTKRPKNVMESGFFLETGNQFKNDQPEIQKLLQESDTVLRELDI